MIRRALVVCTANVCRSPVVERILQRELDSMLDVDANAWVVRSAGTTVRSAPMDPETVRAAADAGIELAGHEPRPLGTGVIATDGADLVLAMTREHLRWVVAVDPNTWPRTFTLKELARRATAARVTAEDTFETWLRGVGSGRRAAALMEPDPLDDIADPYGLPRRAHEVMIAEVIGLVRQLLACGPWRPAAGRAESPITGGGKMLRGHPSTPDRPWLR